MDKLKLEQANLALQIENTRLKDKVVHLEKLLSNFSKFKIPTSKG